MGSRDLEEHDEHQGSDSPHGELATGDVGPSADPQVIETDDPVISSGLAFHPDWTGLPDQAMAIATSPIREPVPYGALNPNLVSAPIESEQPPQDRSYAGDREGRQDRAEQDRHSKKERSKSMPHRNDDRDESGAHREDERRQSVPAPSFTRGWLLPGFVSLICGVAGAWGYWHFFGPAKEHDQKSSSKESDSAQKEPDEGKVREVEAEWKAAAKERDQALASAKAAQRSEDETKAILEFFKKKLLAAGHPGDVSLSDAFWAGAAGKGKNLTLRQAVDMTESQVADTFADRPLGEAAVREMLGLAYLSLGDAAQAVKQYERALSLREAMQGFSHPDAAACRNQLAVAYRLAGRTAEAGRLFDHNPLSTTHASALATRGSMLLFQNNPAEAELKLRECLNIRQKIQPEDWTTFETMSILGEALLDQKKFAEAELMLLSGYKGMKPREDTISPQDKPRFTKALERLVKLYEALGKQDEAMKWRRELEAVGAAKKS